MRYWTDYATRVTNLAEKGLEEGCGKEKNPATRGAPVIEGRRKTQQCTRVWGAFELH